MSALLSKENPGSDSKSFTSEWSHQNVQRRPLWKIFNLLAAKEERKERLISCGPNLEYGGGAPAGPGCWGRPRSQLRGHLFI